MGQLTPEKFKKKPVGRFINHLTLKSYKFIKNIYTLKVKEKKTEALCGSIIYRKKTTSSTFNNNE